MACYWAKKPSSRKLQKLGRPMTTWSSTSIFRSCPARIRSRVTAMSAELGAGSPEGCECMIKMADALAMIASLKTSLAETSRVSAVPIVTSWWPLTRRRVLSRSTTRHSHSGLKWDVLYVQSPVVGGALGGVADLHGLGRGALPERYDLVFVGLGREFERLHELGAEAGEKWGLGFVHVSSVSGSRLTHPPHQSKRSAQKRDRRGTRRRLAEAGE